MIYLVVNVFHKSQGLQCVYAIWTLNNLNLSFSRFITCLGFLYQVPFPWMSKGFIIKGLWKKRICEKTLVSRCLLPIFLRLQEKNPWKTTRHHFCFCPPLAWQCAEHFGRMWQCQNCRKVSQHRADLDLFHQSIAISRFTFSLQTLSRTFTVPLPLSTTIYMQPCWHVFFCSTLPYAVPFYALPNDLSTWHSLNSGIQAVLGRALRLARLKFASLQQLRFEDSTRWNLVNGGPYGPYRKTHVYIYIYYIYIYLYHILWNSNEITSQKECAFGPAKKILHQQGKVWSYHW